MYGDDLIVQGINPIVLLWARETYALSKEEATKKLGFKDTKKQTAVQKLTDLETGNSLPTYGILDKMAKAYKQSLLVLYLPNPPKRTNIGKDFRTLPNTYDVKKDAKLYVLIKDLIVKKDIIRSVLEEESILEEENIPTVPFVNSLNRKDTIQNTAQKIIQYFNLTDLQTHLSKSSKASFDYLRSQIENHGIFVLLAGNLGSYHTDIGVDVFRGYALTDTIAPFILINSHDAETAQSFTLLHELLHLGLGETGYGNSSFSDHGVEKFCNDVTSEILLPDIQKEFPNNFIDLHKAKDAISDYVKRKHVSRSMVAYRFFKEGLITQSIWLSLDQQFLEEYRNFKEKNKKSTGSGANYYVVKKQRLGNNIINLVNRAVAENLLSVSNAAKVLNVAPRNVYTLLDT